MCAYVLVAEDDPRQAEVIQLYLESDGHVAETVGDGRAALDRVRRRPPDLLVVDVMMPGMDGLELCRTLRDESDVLMLMLTARSEEEDLLVGLELGADDYLVKPYSPPELLARVRTLLRRTRVTPHTREAVRRFGLLRIDPVRHEVSFNGRAVVLTRGEFAILDAMSAQPGRVFTRGQLLAETSGLDRDSTERTIDVHVMNLRRKIEPDRRHPAYVITVHGIGYKLQAGND